jgi:hypothetical protein
MSRIRRVTPRVGIPREEMEAWYLKRFFEEESPTCWIVRLRKSGLVCALVCGDLPEPIEFADEPLNVQRVSLARHGGVTFSPEYSYPIGAQP